MTHPESNYGTNLEEFAGVRPVLGLRCHAQGEPGREPVRMKGPMLERCVDCGVETKSGIYVRDRVDMVKFPPTSEPAS